MPDSKLVSFEVTGLKKGQTAYDLGWDAQAEPRLMNLDELRVESLDQFYYAAVLLKVTCR